ncbi:MAG: hypothetical protein PHW10_02400 [Candidatus Peribacteraceae bacterium]|nr:hypothetical protein [Candidatus Peribacteraceae bacterium]
MSADTESFEGWEVPEQPTQEMINAAHQILALRQHAKEPAVLRENMSSSEVLDVLNRGVGFSPGMCEAERRAHAILAQVKRNREAAGSVCNG